MTIKKISAAAVFSSVYFLSIFFSANIYSDALVVNGEIICNDYNSLSWQNDQLVLNCNDQVLEPPVVQPPVVQPPPIIPTPEPNLPPIVNNGTCPDPEQNTRIERFNGKGIDREFTVSKGTILSVPFISGEIGEVRRIGIIEPARGEHFQKTTIISKCPGVYNPEEYDFNTSVDICVVTGLELSFNVIAGFSRGDFPLSDYRCVILPNTQYYVNVIQRDSGRRPPYRFSNNNTCRTNECGARIIIR